jgi:hypothetical protein
MACAPAAAHDFAVSTVSGMVTGIAGWSALVRRAPFGATINRGNVSGLENCITVPCPSPNKILHPTKSFTQQNNGIPASLKATAMSILPACPYYRHVHTA